MGLPAVSSIVNPVRVSVFDARLNMDYDHPGYLMDRSASKLEIDSEPIKLEIDNRAFFDSMGLKSIGALAQELIGRGERAADEATVRYCKEGQILQSPHSGGVSQIARMRTEKSIESMLVFIPKNPPELSWEGGQTQIEYTPDTLRFDWITHRVKFDYTPYSIEFSAG